MGWLEKPRDWEGGGWVGGVPPNPWVFPTTPKPTEPVCIRYLLILSLVIVFRGAPRGVSRGGSASKKPVLQKTIRKLTLKFGALLLRS